MTNISKDEIAYVQVTIDEIINPGTKEQKRVTTKKGSKNSFIVSPQKLIIPPKGKKILRFVSLHKNLEKDKIYRIKVAPVIGKVDAKGITTIRTLFAYGVLAIVRPENEKDDLRVVLARCVRAHSAGARRSSLS